MVLISLIYATILTGSCGDSSECSDHWASTRESRYRYSCRNRYSELSNYCDLQFDKQKITQSSNYGYDLNQQQFSLWVLLVLFIFIARFIWIFLLNLKTVSGVHARIEKKDGVLLVTDLDSTNGTFIGEKRLKPGVAASISSGSYLTFGKLSNLSLLTWFIFPLEITMRLKHYASIFVFFPFW